MISVQIERYRAIAPIMQCGDYYRLSSPYDPKQVTAWEFVSKDRSQAVVQAVVVRAQANPIVRRIYLRGLDPQAHYRHAENGAVFTGAALMHAGLPLPQTMGDFQAVALRFERV